MTEEVQQKRGEYRRNNKEDFPVCREIERVNVFGGSRGGRALSKEDKNCAVLGKGNKTLRKRAEKESEILQLSERKKSEAKRGVSSPLRDSEQLLAPGGTIENEMNRGNSKKRKESNSSPSSPGHHRGD